MSERRLIILDVHAPVEYVCGVDHYWVGCKDAGDGKTPGKLSLRHCKTDWVKECTSEEKKYILARIVHCESDDRHRLPTYRHRKGPGSWWQMQVNTHPPNAAAQVGAPGPDQPAAQAVAQ